MLFNSYTFIFLFLPITALIFFGISRLGFFRAALFWLFVSSLVFYGCLNPQYVGLILISVIFNYTIGVTLNKTAPVLSKKWLLFIGISGNLGLLGYYKYANFFIQNINALAGTNYHFQFIVLPLAISFFTFQQITYLVDTYSGDTYEYNFLNYCLFITFFPQLIAGPIVRHREMMPQFSQNNIYKFNHENLALGLTIFFLGLFKKIILADGIAAYATPVFDAAELGTVITFFEAWCGALAYTFQLYFDFSGYTDMAIGVARIFGIHLPINFYSPYKAINISEFWQRWHVTLSRFLRDYLYIPLGGSQRGTIRRYLNLLITMTLGGFWHGAGWTFVAWGFLHGFYLMVNHAWHSIRHTSVVGSGQTIWWKRGVAQMVTFVAVVIAWVFFRAESFHGAANIVQGMIGLHGILLPSDLSGSLSLLNGIIMFQGKGLGSIQSLDVFIWVFLSFGIVMFLPNTNQISGYTLGLHRKLVESGKSSCKLQWQPSIPWLLFIAFIGVIALLKLQNVSEFLYLNF